MMSKKILKSENFDTSEIRKHLFKGFFPIYTSEESAYLTSGDIYLLLHSYFILKDDSNILNASKGEDYLPENYRKIISHLLKNKLISRYIDGKVHIDSPVSGLYFVKLFEALRRSTGDPYIRLDEAFTGLEKEMSLKGYKKILLSPGKFSITRVKRYLSRNRFPIFAKKRKPYITSGGLYLILYSMLILKDKEDVINLKKSTASKSERLEYLPRVFRGICGYLLNKKVIQPGPDGMIRIDIPLNTFDYLKLIRSFKNNIDL